MRRFRRYLFVLFVAMLPAALAWAQQSATSFRVLAIAEKGGIHQPFVDAAKIWLGKQAAIDHFTVEYIEDTKEINAAYLARYQVFVQLNYPPYNWTPEAAAAFTEAIEKGTIGWVGFHHATLLGEFDGFPMWPWFSRFMGDIRFSNYIPKFATATVHVETTAHPVMKGVPATFTIENEEWYQWNRSPRPNVHVLANVDEDSYSPDSPVKMGGDHPVIWSNEHVKARNVYIFMGHHGELFHNTAFTTIFHNALLWAAGR
ncbi:ThuA domain-containing protein [Edaphobacter aggregans]|uniref:ThuA domain-containing protein n=1 Tax=Edaphobacter aggregans TaxID=570835 RepID=UPI000553369D|nr:ThuA domain-containing protein [Edaphobacter aggregans]